MRPIALALLCAFSSGCLLWTGERIPNLVGTGAKPGISTQPRIEVVLHHVHTMDGKDAGGAATDASYKVFKESFERVRSETPFLAASGVGIVKPDYVLDLETEVAEHGKTGAIVSGATLMLIPAFPSSDVIIRGTLEDPAGNVIGHYDASGEMKGVIQLLLLPLFPVTLFTMPGKDLYDDTFRDIFLLVEKDLAARASS